MGDIGLTKVRRDYERREGDIERVEGTRSRRRV